MQLDLKSTKSRMIIDFRNSGFRELLVLGKYNYNKAEKGLSEHRHNGMLEICYYDKGSQIFSVAGQNHLVKGGDVFLHYPNETHSSGGYPEEKGCLYWMIIRLPKNKVRETSEVSEIALLCARIISLKKRHFKGNPAVKKILEEMFHVAKGSDDSELKRIRIRVLAQQYLLKLVDCATKGIKETDNERLNKILKYIDANITTRVDISSLAREINISESRFKALFKELTGLTPGDYVQRKRVEKAIAILKGNSRNSLTEIAHRLNFSSPQYLGTVIKKYTGKTPELLRNSRER